MVEAYFPSTPRTTRAHQEATRELAYPTRPGYTSGFDPPLPGAYTPAPPAVARGSSVILHKGFWDLLGYASGTLRGLPPPLPAATETLPSDADVLTPLLHPRTATPATPSGSPSPQRKNKRISVDMISSPTGFASVAIALVSASSLIPAQSHLARL
jgi:hypothetical protein